MRISFLNITLRKATVITILSLIIIIFIATQYGTIGRNGEIPDNYKLQRYGIVSEDGTLEVNKVQFIDKEELQRELEAEQRRIDKINARKNRRKRIDSKRLRKLRQKPKKKADNKDDSSIQKEKARLEAINILNKMKIDKYIEEGEPESELFGLDARGRRLFLKQVQERKREKDSA